MFERHIHTEITIFAPIERIWGLITDFQSYPKWNPLMLKVQGEPIEGEKLKILIHLFLAADMTATPIVLAVKMNEELRWKGGLPVPGILEGEHILELEEIENGGVKLIQREIWSGIMAPFFIIWMGNEIYQGFQKMNEEVKAIAEA